jgi:hypothetical protein
VIRERSATLLRRQDAWQFERARELVVEKVRSWASQQPDDNALYRYLEDEAESYFRVGQRRAKGNYSAALREVRERYQAGPVDRKEMIRDFSAGVFAALSADFRDNFLTVHSKLGRSIGFIAPRKGPHPRFVLGDTLLKTLVTANLRAGDALSFGALLERLYTRYGIVVGPQEADKAGLIERLRINEEYYTYNRDALLARMKRAGLVTQYSDATALVSRQ